MVLAYNEEEEDLVVGIVLPLLHEVSPNEDHAMFHFNRAEAGALELKGLVARVDHDKNDSAVVGSVLTSALRDDSPHKRVLLTINPSTANGIYASDRVATQEYRGLSLGHAVGYTVVGSVRNGGGQRYYVKTPNEISFCDVGWRDYSKIEHDFACRKTLRRLPDADLHTYVEKWQYGDAVRGIEIGARNTPQRNAYIDALCSAVTTRRDAVLPPLHLDREELLVPLDAFPHRLTPMSATTQVAASGAPALAPTAPPATSPTAPATAAPPAETKPAAAATTPSALAPLNTLTADQMRNEQEVLKRMAAAEEQKNAALEDALKMSKQLKELLADKAERERVAAEEEEKKKAVVRERLAAAAAPEVVDRYVASGVLKPEYAAEIKRDCAASLQSDPIGLERRITPLIDIAASRAADRAVWEEQAKAAATTAMKSADTKWYMEQVNDFTARTERGNAMAAEIAQNQKASFDTRFGAASAPAAFTVAASASTAPPAAAAAAAAQENPAFKRARVEPAVQVNASSRSIMTPVGQSATAQAGTETPAVMLRQQFDNATKFAGRPPTYLETVHMNALTGKVYASADRRNVEFEMDTRVATANGMPVKIAVNPETFARSEYTALLKNVRLASDEEVRFRKYRPAEDKRVPPGNAFGEVMASSSSSMLF